MRKTLYALLLPVIAVAAMAMTAGAAQAAEPHWFLCEKVGEPNGKFSDSECENAKKEGAWNWVEVKEGVPVHVVTFGALTFNAPTLKIIITCQVLDRGTIENQAAGGVDSVALFENYECVSTGSTVCTTPEIKPGGLPWSSKLEAGPVDAIGPVEVTVFCGGVNQGTFTGTLKPTIGNSVANFTATTGELTGPGGVKAKVEGTDHILTNAGDNVTAK